MRIMKKAVALAIAVALSGVPALATGTEGWRWPVSGSALLPYGASYTSASGGAATHGGLDIAGEPGEAVRACAAGEVTFAGKVPAGEGAQAFAVTVLTADGLRVTYLPLRCASVSKGARVGAGDRVGTLADDGDASSSSTHLHLGVRRGDARLDPASFLAGPGAPAPAPEPASAPEPAHASVSAPAAGAAHAAAAPAASPVVASVPGAAAAPAASAAGVAARPQVVLTPADAFRAAGRDVSAALRGTPMLRRIGEISSAPVLDTARVRDDLRSGRGWLGKALLALGLLAVGGACVVPVARAVRSAGEASASEPALVRRSVR